MGSRHIVSTPYDTRLHQYINSIQFDGEILTLREAADRGYLKLNPIPGRQQSTTHSITSFLLTDEGRSRQEPIDMEAEIDPTGTGVKMSIEEALAKELIRPITSSVMIGYEVV